MEEAEERVDGGGGEPGVVEPVGSWICAVREMAVSGLGEAVASGRVVAAPPPAW
jgi:hypothetical protein